LHATSTGGYLFLAKYNAAIKFSVKE